MNLEEEVVDRKMELNRIGIRTFVQRPGIATHHSYIVGCDTFGLSERLQEQVVDDELTLRKFRADLEILKVNGMCRRPPIFCEILSLMQMAPNPFMYPDKRKYTEYRLGVVACSDPSAFDLPYIIPKHLEATLKCLELPRVHSYPTIVVVPITQVSPMTDQVKGWKERNLEIYHFEYPPKEAAKTQLEIELEAEDAELEKEEAEAKAKAAEERKRKAERQKQAKLKRLQKQLRNRKR